MSVEHGIIRHGGSRVNEEPQTKGKSIIGKIGEGGNWVDVAPVTLSVNGVSTSVRLGANFGFYGNERVLLLWGMLEDIYHINHQGPVRNIKDFLFFEPIECNKRIIEGSFQAKGMTSQIELEALLGE